MARKPDSRLASRILPGPLYRAATHIFEQKITGCMLVGGSALAGYYAGHRRSDDLDLFARDGDAHRAAVLAVKSLRNLGAQTQELLSSSQFYKTSCTLDGHAFTVDVVLDANLHSVGESRAADDGVVVASLETLLKQKAATLVSRCSEKDLYDLMWLFRAKPDLDLRSLIELGSQIDGGLTAEAALTSLLGAGLSKSSCGFSHSQSADEVFGDITSLKKSLALGLHELALSQPAPRLGKLVRALRK
jgi:hypothetical protein